MKRRALSTLLLMMTFCVVMAQSGGERIVDNPKALKSVQVTSLGLDATYESKFDYPNENLNDIFIEKLDSMVIGWYVQNVYNKQATEANGELILASNEMANGILSNSVSDSVFIQRLENIDSFVDLSYNGTVKNFIKMYTEKRKAQMSLMLGLSQYYFPMFEEVLDKYDMPLELKYMAIIESALNPRAYSRVGACGLWQFMYTTGKGYGLEITSYVDERRDPRKATEAAARFLKDLYNIYHDWHLVIAAYNCGPGNVNKAIRRAGGTRNYWKIYYNLPRETRGYVPSFIGASYAMEYAKEYGIEPTLPKFPVVTDTVMVSNYLHFNQLSAHLDLPVEQLRELNPQYRKDVLPAKETKKYMLRLPADKIGTYLDNEQRILAYNRNTYFPNNSLVKIGSTSNSGYASVGDVGNKDKVYYKVKSGDNVGFIASWFHVRSNDLRYWNNIRRNMIRVGQRLVVYVPKGKGSYYKKFDTMSFSQKQRSIGKTVNTTASAPVKSTPSDGNYVYYTVRNGDTLWGISKKYSGVTQSDLMSLNKLTSRSKLKPGMKIKIKPKA